MERTINNINMKLNCVINAIKVLLNKIIAKFILDELMKNIQIH